MPWSYSSLQSHETCPRRHHLTKIAKVIKEPQTEATMHGNEVHRALEVAVRDTLPLPEKYKQYIPIVEVVRKAPGVKHTEYKFGLTRSFTPTDFWAKDVWCRGVLDLRVVGTDTVTVLDWKGLDVTTPIPTPAGFTLMADLAVGDTVFDMLGARCTVTAKSDVHHRPCYRITFDDTSSVVCDDEHLWHLAGGRVVATPNLRVKDTIPVAGALDLPAADLPLDPYVLGLWLADGKHTSGEVSKPDMAIWEEVQRRGFALGADTGEQCPTRTIKGIRGTLVSLGLMRNKHIPQVYLRASVAQRLDLLRGLMDGDGSVNPHRRQAIFTSCDKVLSSQVRELALTLGQRVLQSRTKQTGFGKTVTAWPLSWRPLNGLVPFLLPRKAERVSAEWGPGKSNVRRVVRVEQVPSTPTQCISVDSPTKTYLCTESFIPTHNTGKPKPDADQLKLFAAAAFALHPRASTVKTGYAWLAYNKLDTETFHRGDEAGIWQEFLPRIQRMDEAIARNDHPPKPSGLCGWCPVGSNMCEFWKGYSGAKR